MRLTFLGTGTSHGVPRIGCQCSVCRSTDPRNNRLRPSVLIETATTSLLVDATPDFRQQALRAGITRVDAVLLTHTHADHFLGLDDLRVFTEQRQKPMPIYASPAAIADVERVFAYACNEKPKYPSLPSFSLKSIVVDQEFSIGDLAIRSVELPHGWGNVYGFVFGREFAYLTDCNAVPPAVVQSVSGVTVLALDGLRARPHPTHLTIMQAAAIAGQIGAHKTFLTHMNHETDHTATEAELPANIRLAYDGLQLEITGNEVRSLA